VTTERWWRVVVGAWMAPDVEPEDDVPDPLVAVEGLPELELPPGLLTKLPELMWFVGAGGVVAVVAGSSVASVGVSLVLDRTSEDGVVGAPPVWWVDATASAPNTPVAASPPAASHHVAALTFSMPSSRREVVARTWRWPNRSIRGGRGGWAGIRCSP
jgi:hypothetical protein